jgi:hypothetical protein
MGIKSVPFTSATLACAILGFVAASSTAQATVYTIDSSIASGEVTEFH